MSALFSPISFGIELSRSVTMPEYKSQSGISLVGERQKVDYADINANINANLLFILNQSSSTFISRYNLRTTWTRTGNPRNIDYREAAVLTSKAELAGGSL